MLTAPSRMSHCHVLHKASEKAAEVVDFSVEILMRLGTKICMICLKLYPIPAMHIEIASLLLQQANFLLAYLQAILCQSALCLGMFLGICHL